MLCLVSPDSMVPPEHPIREIKRLADTALAQLSPVFDALYSEQGRPSVPPETLLKSSLLMALYSVRSERQLCEQLRYNMLFRWFLDMDMTDEVFDQTTFSKNRERMMSQDVAGQFFRTVVGAAKADGHVSRDHFTVDGTLIEAWASMKSFKPRTDEGEGRAAKNRAKAARRAQRGKGKGRKGPPSGGSNVDVDFKGQTRRNDTHASTTDPEAKLMRKGLGKEAKLSFGAHALMENRNGLLIDVRITEASGRSEWEAGLAMLKESDTRPGATIGADRGYDLRHFVDGCRALGVVPHVAQRKMYSAIDGRTTRHGTYGVSQRVRKRVEEIFGWAKTIGGLRKTRYKGTARTQLAAYLVGAAYNLLRLAKLRIAAA